MSMVHIAPIPNQFGGAQVIANVHSIFGSQYSYVVTLNRSHPNPGMIFSQTRTPDSNGDFSVVFTLPIVSDVEVYCLTVDGDVFLDFSNQCFSVSPHPISPPGSYDPAILLIGLASVAGIAGYFIFRNKASLLRV